MITYYEIQALGEWSPRASHTDAVRDREAKGSFRAIRCATVIRAEHEHYTLAQLQEIYGWKDSSLDYSLESPPGS